MIQSKTKKTNMHWYPYAEFGSYYKLVNGVLFQSPMKADGSLEGTEIEVEWENLVTDEDRPRMLEILEELEQKD